MTTSGAPLEALATDAGLQTQWDDAWGQPQALSPDAIRTVLDAMGLPCATADQCEASRAWLAADDAAHALPPLITADQGKPVPVPWPHVPAQRPYQIEYEDGRVADGVAQRRDAGMLLLAPIDTIGYHHVTLGDTRTTIAVAPPRCYGVADALAEAPHWRAGSPTARPWGLAVQLYGLRRGALTGLGDLTALAELCEAAAREQADAVAINPLHAGFAALPERYSPYSPSSRLFLNPLYADPTAVFGADAVAQGCAALRLTDALLAAEARREIDWPTVAAARYALLRWLWERHTALLPAAAVQQFQAFRARGGNALHAHACFEALQAAQLAGLADGNQGGDGSKKWGDNRDNGAAPARAAATDWRRWPEAWRDPSSPAVAAAARAHAAEVNYHTFLQWLATQGMAAAQQRARAAGMAIGVIADLAVGTDPGGSHAWTRQAEILRGFHAGAPPDVYNPLGQDWGVAVFSPRGLRHHGYAAFIEMLRANLAHAGGLRIDHVLGLARMWLVPEGASAREGAYLTYPLTDLLRLVALESWRHRAIVIGENLGTVPASLNDALAARGVLGIDVLWFERAAAADRKADQEGDRIADTMAAGAETASDTGAAHGAARAGARANADTGAEARPNTPDTPDTPDTLDTPSTHDTPDKLDKPETAAFLPVSQWPPHAVATTTTHDLPTIAGWWRGRDIAWRARLEQLGANETEADAMAARAADRAALWHALCAAGLASGAEPDAAPIEAILAWLGQTGTPLRLVPIEDLVGSEEQPNLPGTVSGHPNWQRRIDGDVRELFAAAAVRARVAALRTGTP